MPPEPRSRVREVRKCRACGRPIPEFRGEFTAYCSRSCLYRSEGEPQRKETVTVHKDDSKGWSRVHMLLSEVRSERIRPQPQASNSAFETRDCKNCGRPFSAYKSQLTAYCSRACVHDRLSKNPTCSHHWKNVRDAQDQTWEDDMREASKKERRKVAKGYASGKLTKWGKPRKAAAASKILKRKLKIARAVRRLYVKRLFKEGKISRPHISDHETKRCEICGKHLPSHDFRICSRSPDGLQSYCLACNEKARKKKARSYNQERMAKRKAMKSEQASSVTPTAC